HQRLFQALRGTAMIFSLIFSSLFVTSSAWKLYDVLLVDTFGDGWKNINLNVTTDGGTSTSYSMNCACKLITINSTDGMLTFNVTSNGSPIAPWEILWMANFSGSVIVGDFSTSAYVNGDFVSVMNPVNYNADSSSNNCQECHHPPPRRLMADAAGAAPRPPAKVIMELYGGSWYNGDGGMTGVCDAAVSADVIDIPDILTYPKYYIMNDKKTKVLQEGTVCKDRSTEYCEDPLPHDGNFVFRVTGFDTDATWRFCGAEGSANEELVFSMKAGKCKADRKHSAADYCAGILSHVVLSGTLSIAGGQGDTLSAFDTKMLEQQITSMFPYQREVTISSYLTTDEVMTVSFKVVVVAEDYGVDGTVDANVESLFSQLSTGVQTPLSAGQFMSVLRNSLKDSPQGTADVLSSMSAVSLVSLELTDVVYEPAPTSVEQPVETPAADEAAEVPTARAEFALSATVVYACAGAAAFTLLAFVIVRAVKRNVDSRTKSHIPLPLESEHDGISLELEDSVEEDAIPKFDLGRTTEKSYFRSSERV
ncbi:unnamed protein product, partial [Symbiodinium microadriaticum]